REQPHIRMLERWLHADDLRVRLAVDETGEAVERAAAHAGARMTGLAILFVQQDAERDGEGMAPEPPQPVGELLDAGFVTDRRVTVRGGRGRLRRIRPAPPMHVVQVFGLRVVRLEVLVAERPRR